MKYPNDVLLAEITMRLRFLKYDAALQEEDKTKIIDELRDKVLYLTFNYPKPDEIDG